MGGAVSMSGSDGASVEALIDGAWVPVRVRLRAGTAARPMVVVDRVGPREGTGLDVVGPNRLRPRRDAA